MSNMLLFSRPSLTLVKIQKEALQVIQFLGELLKQRIWENCGIKNDFDLKNEPERRAV